MMSFEEAYRYGDGLRIEEQGVISKEYHEACLRALKMQVPQKVVVEDWSPSYCPNCQYELSTSKGDGYYAQPSYLNMCPECGQKICWK